jgi:hypothetical protein
VVHRIAAEARAAELDQGGDVEEVELADEQGPDSVEALLHERRPDEGADAEEPGEVHAVLGEGGAAGEGSAAEDAAGRPSWVRVVPGWPMARIGRSVWCRPLTAVSTWMKAPWLSSWVASRAVNRAPDRTLIRLAVARALAESSSTTSMVGASQRRRLAPQG